MTKVGSAAWAGNHRNRPLNRKNLSSDEPGKSKSAQHRLRQVGGAAPARREAPENRDSSPSKSRPVRPPLGIAVELSFGIGSDRHTIFNCWAVCIYDTGFRVLIHEILKAHRRG
jgi:hypothetical protein